MLINVTKAPYFIRVAETGSISRAAEQLKMAQPALSHYIRDLESDVGAPLFERNGRGVSLTQVGHRLYLEAKTLLDKLETAELDVASRYGPSLSSAKVGVVPWMIERLGLPLADSVRREMPRTTLQVIEGQNSSLLEWLDQGVIDVGVSFYEFHSAYVDVEPVFDEKIFLLGSAKSPELASISEISFEDVTQLPLVLPPSPHPLRHRVERKALQAGHRLNIVTETEAASIAIYIASAGMGFTLIPRAACRDLDQRGLKAVPIAGSPLMQTLVIMTSLKRPLSTCETALHRLVRFHLDAIKAETEAEH